MLTKKLQLPQKKLSKDHKPPSKANWHTTGSRKCFGSLEQHSMLHPTNGAIGQNSQTPFMKTWTTKCQKPGLVMSKGFWLEGKSFLRAISLYATYQRWSKVHNPS